LLACLAVIGLVVLAQLYQRGGGEGGETESAAFDGRRRGSEELASILEEVGAIVCSGGKSEGATGGGCEVARGLGFEEGKGV
jgi:hypothetical protein